MLNKLANSINWPALSVWVFIAQLVENCSTNAEARGSNPVEALKNFFFGLKAIAIHCDDHIFISCVQWCFPSSVSAVKVSKPNHSETGF